MYLLFALYPNRGTDRYHGQVVMRLGGRGLENAD